MLFSKPNKTVGLDIGTHSVKAIQLAKVSGRLRVERAGYALVDRNLASTDPIAAQAEAVREALRNIPMAQNIVLKHRERLSGHFKNAVNDHRWSEAAQVGDLIIAEYPNTKMADEVRSMIDALRVRASQAAVMAQG